MRNKVYTDAEYIAQGFSENELPMIRRHDELMVRYERGGEQLKPRQMLEQHELARRLGL